MFGNLKNKLNKKLLNIEKNVKKKTLNIDWIGKKPF